MYRLLQHDDHPLGYHDLGLTMLPRGELFPTMLRLFSVP